MVKALIVGGGIGGLSTSLALVAQGIDVHLVEKTPHIRALGSGITLMATAVRALDRLGLADECVARGFGTDQFDVCDPDGGVVATTPLPPLVPDTPGLLGMIRPTLCDILLERARANGVRIQTGIGPTRITVLPEQAEVTFDDGTVQTYDLVVGADGIRSTVRGLVFGEYSTVFRNQVCIRAVFDRPAGLVNETQYLGVRQTHVGFTPISETQMYMYCCVPIPDTSRPPTEDLPELLRQHLKPFGGIVGEMRDAITDETPINYAPLETIVVPTPWNRGTVVLVGDAAHATTPQLASGGAMCLEDAVALGEELARSVPIPAALDAYTARRFDRARYVVNASVQLTEWQVQEVTPDAAQQALIAEAVQFLSADF